MNPLDKARKVRSDRAAAEIWKQVSSSQERNHCKCALHEGMSRDDLDAITPTWGCVSSGRWICPALDLYRRLVGPRPLSDEERALQEGV